MEFIQNLFKAWFGSNTKIYSASNNSGPNTLEELLEQFNLPAKQKTDTDIIRDYQVKETLAALEVDMLRMDRALNFRGYYGWSDEDGNKLFDFVPCVVRPEVLYCCNGKS